jgi:hypothetical protein
MAGLRILTAVTALALAWPAAAQTPPTVGGPYYIVDADAAVATLIAGGTRTLQGDIGTVTAVVLISEATRQEAGGAARMDMAYEFQCRRNTLRNTLASFYLPDGSLLQSIDTSDVAWEAVSPGAASEIMKVFACTGATPPDAVPFESLAEIVSGYAAWSVIQ